MTGSRSGLPRFLLSALSPTLSWLAPTLNGYSTMTSKPLTSTLSAFVHM